MLPRSFLNKARVITHFESGDTRRIVSKSNTSAFFLYSSFPSAEDPYYNWTTHLIKQIITIIKLLLTPNFIRIYYTCYKVKMSFVHGWTSFIIYLNRLLNQVSNKYNLLFCVYSKYEPKTNFRSLKVEKCCAFRSLILSLQKKQSVQIKTTHKIRKKRTYLDETLKRHEWFAAGVVVRLQNVMSAVVV